jgi:hypothetical protein
MGGGQRGDEGRQIRSAREVFQRAGRRFVQLTPPWIMHRRSRASHEVASDFMPPQYYGINLARKLAGSAPKWLRLHSSTPWRVAEG